MRVRCIIGGYGSPFVKGKVYDAAEIMEMPGHAMVRKPNGQWPKPGDRFFAWHPEERFASPPNGLEILSCGYDHHDIECYGVIIPVSRYSRIPRFNSTLDRIMDDLPPALNSLWTLCFTKVRTSVCFPELERSFYLLAFDYGALGRETSYAAAARGIKRVLSRLDLSDLSVGIDDLYLEFWAKSWRQPGGLTWRNRA